MNNYLTIVRDANNVAVHFLTFSAINDSEAAILSAYYLNPNRSFNGILEQERMRRFTYPFRFNCGQSLY